MRGKIKSIMHIKYISKHLDQNNLKLRIHDVQSLCCFTGAPINQGVLKKELIKPTFTDHSYIRYHSEYASVDAALCIEAVIKIEKGMNSLRNYSYLVTENHLRILKRDELIDIILNPPKGNFVFCITYSNKKHTSYKASISSNQEVYTITTDEGDVIVRKYQAVKIYSLIQKWYSIINGKKETSTQPTYFTKQEILQGSHNLKRIKAYGIKKYYKENHEIQKYRDTKLIKLLVHALNKK